MAEDEKKKVEEKKPKKTESAESGGINKKIIVIVVVAVVIIAIVAFVLLSGEDEENGDNGDENHPPNAQIELMQENFYVNQIVFFNSTSYDIDGDTITHSWDFGDDSPVSNDVNTTHTYDEVGLYNITLTVTDEHGKETTDAINLTVRKIPTAELAVTVLTTSPLPPSYSVTVNSIDDEISTDLVHFWVIDSDTSGSLSDGNVATAATGQYANVVFTDATETGILSAGDFFTVTDYPQTSQSHIELEDGDIFRLTMEGNPDDVIVEKALE